MEQIIVTGCVDQWFPLLVVIDTDTEGQVEGDVDKASYVFGSFDVPPHPKYGICYAR